VSLNQQSPIPLYRQLADRIRHEIDRGVHAVATKIPSENVAGVQAHMYYRRRDQLICFRWQAPVLRCRTASSRLGSN